VPWLAKSVVSVVNPSLIEPLTEIRDALCDGINNEYVLKIIIADKIQELKHLEEVEQASRESESRDNDDSALS
jgi:hypothetical protein